MISKSYIFNQAVKYDARVISCFTYNKKEAIAGKHESAMLAILMFLDLGESYFAFSTTN